MTQIVDSVKCSQIVEDPSGEVYSFIFPEKIVPTRPSPKIDIVGLKALMDGLGLRQRCYGLTNN